MTYAILDVSASTFREIQQKLEAAGYVHAFREAANGQLVIDLLGVVLHDGESDDEDCGHALAREAQPLLRRRES